MDLIKIEITIERPNDDHDIETHIRVLKENLNYAFEDITGFEMKSIKFFDNYDKWKALENCNLDNKLKKW